MSLSRLILAVLLVQSSYVSALVLTAGDDYVYDVSTINSNGSFSSIDNISVLVTFTDNLFGPSDSIRMEYFENTLSDIPFFSVDTGTFIETSTLFYNGTDSSPWANIQGFVRLSVLTGSVNLDIFNIQFTNNNRFFSGSESVTDVAMSPVPVPAAAWLFGSVLFGFLGFARRKIGKH